MLIGIKVARAQERMSALLTRTVALCLLQGTLFYERIQLKTRKQIVLDNLWLIYPMCSARSLGSGGRPDALLYVLMGYFPRGSPVAMTLLMECVRTALLADSARTR